MLEEIEKLIKELQEFKESYKIEHTVVEYPMFEVVDYDDPCSRCSNHPRNGGSGICHCTIPYLRNPTYWKK